jgi:hypothetical protein
LYKYEKTDYWLKKINLIITECLNASLLLSLKIKVMEHKEILLKPMKKTKVHHDGRQCQTPQHKKPSTACPYVSNWVYCQVFVLFVFF